MSAKKSILFLGGGELGTPAISWAKKIGFTVIVNDKKADAPGKKLADVAISFDSTDFRGLATWVLANNISHNIQYCHCNSDFGLITANIIHEILGLPRSALKAIFCSLDKALMKQCWSPQDVNFPQSFLTESFEEALNFANQISWPVIVKPASASGSQGVGLAMEESELNPLINEAKHFTTNKKVIIEQFIHGTHHDVNGLFWNGEFFPAGIGDRYFTKLPFFVPHHGYFPSCLENAKLKMLYELLEKGARQMGITHGPVKADCVFCEGKSYVYEISSRFHGDIFTVRTMGILEKLNPLYNFFQFIYGNTDKPVNNFGLINKVGGWKTIFQEREIEILKNSKINGVFCKNSYSSRLLPKNNDEIIGLAWAEGSDYNEINQILRIDNEYEQI